MLLRMMDLSTGWIGFGAVAAAAVGGLLARKIDKQLQEYKWLRVGLAPAGVIVGGVLFGMIAWAIQLES